MNINIHAQGFPLTEALDSHVHTRLGFTLSRAGNRIRRVIVRLSDLNGPRGGVDKRCQVEIRIDGLPVVIVDDVQSDMYTAIDRASARAARTMMRRLALDGDRQRQAAVQLLHSEPAAIWGTRQADGTK
jgi:ribosome-associated translation inhibitor RaiA